MGKNGKRLYNYVRDDWLLFRRNASRLALYISLIDGAHLLPWRRFPIIARIWRSLRRSCTEITHLSKSSRHALKVHREKFISLAIRRYMYVYVRTYTKLSGIKI
jgi:hypothetical protein